MTPGVLEVAGELARRGRPFVLATVVWRRSPTSGKQGSKAVILPDGTMRGWLSGACAEPTVISEARAAMADGHPRLLFMGCLLYTSPSPRDLSTSRMPSSA